MDKPKNPAAQSLGAMGGRKRSQRKAAAVRANGAKGGRPRKDPPQSPPALPDDASD